MKLPLALVKNPPQSVKLNLLVHVDQEPKLGYTDIKFCSRRLWSVTPNNSELWYLNGHLRSKNKIQFRHRKSKNNRNLTIDLLSLCIYAVCPQLLIHRLEPRRMLETVIRCPMIELGYHENTYKPCFETSLFPTLFNVLNLAWSHEFTEKVAINTISVSH